MHKTTERDLETLFRWVQDVVRADSYACALQNELPDAVLTSGFGDLALHIEADSISGAVPLLRAARAVGFSRDGPLTEDAANQTTIWNYTADEVKLKVVLRLRNNDYCRYVQVGTKQVPDMRLLCGAELEEWEANAT